MKTQVILFRKLFDGEIRQQSKTGFYCMNDLFALGNKFRAKNDMPLLRQNDWINYGATQSFIKELEVKFGKVKSASRGRNAVTWLHPFLFIDAALALDPKLKIEVYSWLFDELIESRNNSGDSYKKMCGALYVNTKSKSTFHSDISRLAVLIKKQCEVSDWNKATEEQLKLRDRIHSNIALLSDVLRDNHNAIIIGITKALDIKELK